MQRTITFTEGDDAKRRPGGALEPTPGSGYYSSASIDKEAKVVLDDAKHDNAPGKNIDITEHLLTAEEVCDKYSVQINETRPQDSFGLGADQAARLLAANGPNALTPPKKKSPLIRFLICLLSLFNLMLIASGILMFVVLAIDYNANTTSVSTNHPFVWAAAPAGDRRAVDANAFNLRYVRL
ncbi:hypothetical protein H4R19_002056 [Coemansia spiralis]|nr:hypothetical protein H4R19_002056 [Coemansia spiralis]